MRKTFFAMFCAVLLSLVLPVGVYAEDSDQSSSDSSGQSTEYREGDKITPENFDSYQEYQREQSGQQDNGTPGGSEG
jgi:hypothetical protein